MISTSLRNKLLIGFLAIDIFVSIMLGVFMYRVAVDMFIKDYKNHKLSIAKFIASVIEGENHEKFTSLESFNDPRFKEYLKIIRSIYQKEPDVRYIYTLNLDKKTNNLKYAIDSNLAENDIVWVESEVVGYDFHILSDTMAKIEHDRNVYSKNFILDSDAGKIYNELVNTEKGARLIINGQEILHVISAYPTRVAMPNGIMDRHNRIGEAKLKIGNKEVKFNLTFSERNTPGSDPGVPFIEKNFMVQRLKEHIKNRTDSTLMQNEKNIYGEYLGAYSPIVNSAGEGIGIVVVEINNREFEDFKKKISRVALLVSLITFFITVIASVILSKYFTKPLEFLTSAVNNLASGNMEILVRINSKDEFGNLAKSFNTMVQNLKIASEVQHNLISEITVLNENLERKVEERTKTIQNQSEELEKQIHIAKKIQLSLLPENIPKLKGAKIGFRYEPMMSVAGDFLDFNVQTDSEIKLFVCDVSGHGVPAAFLATMVKMSIQDCYDERLEPSDSLKRVYRSLYGKMSGHFISAIFCKVNLITGVMVSANAGHLPLLLLRKNGNSEFILSRGRIINELFPPNPVEITTKLDSGDKIVLYTDGITEAKNPQNEMFGEDRLKDVCEANASLEPIKICNAIFDTIHKFTNNQNLHYDDDITILIMEYSGANQNGNSV